MSKKYKLADVIQAKEEGMDEGGWLVVLSDMMMLLLTFFVMLFIVIEPADQDYIGTLRKIGDALGGKSHVDRLGTPAESLEKQLEGLIKDSNLVKQVSMETDSRGLVLFASGDLFFKPGTAELTGDIRFFLDSIAKILKGNQSKVTVEGHTDDTPIKSRLYPSNWELATARASAVIRYLIDEKGLHGSRFTAAGYAHHKPRFAMIPENRSKNRRVEIIVSGGGASGGAAGGVEVDGKG